MTRGVRAISDLLDRCRVVDGCWHWADGRDGNGRPSLWLPALGRRVTLGTAICVLRTGKPPAKGVVWHCTCDTPNCANPAHRKAGTRSSQMLAAGIQRDAVTRARIAAGKRARSNLTDDAVRAIRASGETLHVLAARHGITPSYASQIRRGQRRREFCAAGASIFNLGISAAAATARDGAV
jgi:hypothetical protein